MKSGDFLERLDGHGNTMGQLIVVSSGFISAIAVGELSEHVIQPALFPSKTIYEQHHDAIIDIEVANTKLAEAKTASENIDDRDTEAMIATAIEHNQLRISTETSLLPADFHPDVSSAASISSGILAGAIVFAAVRRGVNRAIAKNHASNRLV